MCVRFLYKAPEQLFCSNSYKLLPIKRQQMKLLFPAHQLAACHPTFLHVRSTWTQQQAALEEWERTHSQAKQGPASRQLPWRTARGDCSGQLLRKELQQRSFAYREILT